MPRSSYLNFELKYAQSAIFVAMLSEVSSFLCRSNDKDLLVRGCSVVVTDSGADGAFLIHHFIAQALKCKDAHSTILLSCAQSFAHYCSIATKLGVSLTRQLETGRLVYIDCFTHLTTQQDSSQTDSSSKDRTKHTFSLDNTFSLRGLYKMLCECLLYVRAVKPDRPVCLVLDDLSMFVSVGVSLAEVVGLAHYCQRMITSPQEGPAGYIVTMVHCEGADSDEDRLARHLLHTSHLTLHTEGLPSGYSRDVHGQLSAVWRNCQPVVKKEAQFKLTDRTAHLFAKGTCSAVL